MREAARGAEREDVESQGTERVGVAEQGGGPGTVEGIRATRQWGARKKTVETVTTAERASRIKSATEDT